MKIAFIIYQGMTVLDFVGVYDPIIRLKTMGFMPELSWELCAISQEVSDENGLRLLPTKINESIQEYDMIIVPGGIRANLQKLVSSTHFIEWLRTANSIPLKASVCTGSLLLGEAGFLKGKKATTHPSAFNELKKYCESVVTERIVDEGDVITARGVTSSIDLGLYLCEKLAGSEVKEKIRQRMDYQQVIK
ncbi:MAG: DJ-1/PfpI family protein [Microcoleus vaginatus WJT46-NPBG5]|jgi:cyclohexyl-isocyanide hydratase|nr:DJ-1/PfpI family protein [Microcoleus vaginatus WJT46-NPBG5]